MRKMPIGIQDFEKLRTENYVYVDKTRYVYDLAQYSTPYFLGRPRRFGKSLLLSTLKAYFQGRKDLFRGLAAGELEKDWIEYPVLHIDMNVASYRNTDDLDAGIDTNLRILEEKWGSDPRDTTVSARFYNLIRRACERSGRKAVVLVDEYDRPLIQTMEDAEAHDKVRGGLKGFYGVLKSADQWLRFALLTGVTKFSQVSVFSDLNQLRDISMNARYAGVCGISARELEENFGPELEALAAAGGISHGEALAEMKKLYDGYHFCEDSEGVFNPFSVINTLADGKFSYYWFKTGTPTFLIDLLKRGDFDLLRFAEGVNVPAVSIDDYRVGGSDPVPLLYQSGYLTIKGYVNGRYILDFPNDEVRHGFLNELLPHYTYRVSNQDFFADYFVEDLRNGDVDGFMTRLGALFAGMPYELNSREERHYQTVFYLVFTLMGQFTRAEVHSAKGRADAVVAAGGRVYVFEFKLDGTAEDALRQIDERGYAAPYAAGSREIVKVGVEFDAAERNIGRWLTAKENGGRKEQL